MAPVDGSRDRGQLILVAAVGLAVTFVALALILNSAIFTSNLASRNIDSGASDVLQVRGAAQDGIGGVIDGVNDPSSATDYGTLESNYEAGMREWANQSAKYGALRGHSVRLSPDVQNYGVRIVDDDETTDLTPRGDSPIDWTVAADVRARNLEMTVTSVTGAPTDSDVENELDDGVWKEGSFFYVDINDGEWRMAVYGDGSGNVKVAVYDADGGGDFSVCSNTPASTPVRIDVGEGLVNGEPCDALRSVAEQTGLYTIHFANGDQAEGSYELTVDRAIEGPSSDVGAFTDVVDRLNHGEDCKGPTYNGFNTAGNYPYVAPALYSSEVTMDFQSEAIEYKSTVRVAADELSEGETAPRITSLTVDDQSGGALGDSGFVVTVDVADPNGDLSAVTVDMSGAASVTKVESVTGRSDTVSVTLDPSVPLGNTFDIQVTVEDGAGTTRSVTQTHESDGDGTGDGSCPE